MAHITRLHLAVKSLFYTHVCAHAHTHRSLPLPTFLPITGVLQCDTCLSLCPEKQPNLKHDGGTTWPQLEVLCHPRACHFIHETKIRGGHRATSRGLGMSLTIPLSLSLVVCGMGQRHPLPPRGVSGFTYTRFSSGPGTGTVLCPHFTDEETGSGKECELRGCTVSEWRGQDGACT